MPLDNEEQDSNLQRFAKDWLIDRCRYWDTRASKSRHLKSFEKHGNLSILPSLLTWTTSFVENAAGEELSLLGSRASSRNLTSCRNPGTSSIGPTLLLFAKDLLFRSPWGRCRPTSWIRCSMEKWEHSVHLRACLNSQSRWGWGAKRKRIQVWVPSSVLTRWCWLERRLCLPKTKVQQIQLSRRSLASNIPHRRLNFPS